MNRIINNPFTAKYPRIDIHGETTATCIAVIESFIMDNIHLKYENIIIIHGKGTGALKKATHDYLKKHKEVRNFYIDPFNEGETIVNLRIH